MEARYQPIEHYGIIGNLRTAALVGMDGSIDWLCLPQFDSPSVFGAILDAEKGGLFRIAPVASGALRQKQYYWPETNVLITRFLNADGIAEVEDYMPVGPGFCLLAEVYWDLEWTLQQQGFDYTYDKRLYDRLCAGHAKPVREHFCAGLDYQNNLARFLENHDEARAATTFSREMHQAAALVTFLSPGLRFFHDGQFQERKNRIPPHLCRRPDEPVDAEIAKFYDRLLKLLRQSVVREGRWQLLECLPAWQGNWTWDCFIACVWERSAEERLLVAVNYAPNQSQGYVRLPFTDLGSRRWWLSDQMSPTTYDRDGNDLQSRGLYLDMSPWQAAVISVTKQD